MVEPELEHHIEIPVPVIRTRIALLEFRFWLLIDLFRTYPSSDQYNTNA